MIMRNGDCDVAVDMDNIKFILVVILMVLVGPTKRFLATVDTVLN